MTSDDVADAVAKAAELQRNMTTLFVTTGIVSGLTRRISRMSEGGSFVLLGVALALVVNLGLVIVGMRLERKIGGTGVGSLLLLIPGLNLIWGAKLFSDLQAWFRLQGLEAGFFGPSATEVASFCNGLRREARAEREAEEAREAAVAEGKLEVRCPECRRTFFAPKTVIGRVGRCSACKHQFKMVAIVRK